MCSGSCHHFFFINSAMLCIFKLEKIVRNIILILGCKNHLSVTVSPDNSVG